MKRPVSSLEFKVRKTCHTSYASQPSSHSRGKARRSSHHSAFADKHIRERTTFIRSYISLISPKLRIVTRRLVTEQHSYPVTVFSEFPKCEKPTCGGLGIKVGERVFAAGGNVGGPSARCRLQSREPSAVGTPIDHVHPTQQSGSGRSRAFSVPLGSEENNTIVTR